MSEEQRDGRISLQERVHRLEREQAKTRKEVNRLRSKRPSDDEPLQEWVGRRVRVRLAPAHTANVIAGELLEALHHAIVVRRYPGEERELIYKTQIACVHLDTVE